MGLNIENVSEWPTDPDVAKALKLHLAYDTIMENCHRACKPLPGIRASFPKNDTVMKHRL
jgi:hypothetical protein